MNKSGLDFDDLPNFIDQFKHIFVASASALILLNDPHIHDYLTHNRGFESGTFVGFDKLDKSRYEGPNFWDAVHYAQNNPNYNMLFW